MAGAVKVTFPLIRLLGFVSVATGAADVVAFGEPSCSVAVGRSVLVDVYLTSMLVSLYPFEWFPVRKLCARWNCVPNAPVPF